MSKPTVLCVFSRILGNKAFTDKLVEILDGSIDVMPTYLFYNVEDYRTYPAPFYVSCSTSLESSWRIKTKFNDTVSTPFDILFFQSFVLTLPFRDLIARVPTAVALDTTPTLAHQLIAQSSPSLSKIKSSLLEKASTHFYRRVFDHVDVFCPWSDWCANSLKNDFYVTDNKISRSMYCHVDQDMWKPSVNKNDHKPVLLFVGNDVIRKGLDFMVDIYTEYLSDLCNLRIISQDPQALLFKNISGIEVHSNLTHAQHAKMVALYKASDIFVFPTRRDQLGLVLCEAISIGLPVISTDVGGAGELVKDGYNGYLMPYGSDKRAWAEKIIHLIGNKEIRAKFGYNSRVLAQEKLNQERFEQIVSDVLGQLLFLIPKNSKG